MSNLRGDTFGGLAAAVLTIPIRMGYGMLALAPLGEESVAQGILAGIYASICGCLVALALGSRTTLIYAPRSVVLGFAVLAFLRCMSKSVIRRVRGNAVHSRKSRKSRDARATELLGAHGGEILLLDLQGPIFFGTAENLADAVERSAGSEVRYIVIDLQRVTEIDSTGAKIILQIHQRLQRQRKHLLLCGVDPGRPLAAVLHDMGVGAVLSGNRLFADAEHALEWAEDQLIANHSQGAAVPAAAPEAKGDAAMPLRDLDAFAHMNDDELAVIQSLVEQRRYEAGAVIFSEGDPGDALYAVLQGSASVQLRLHEPEREARLTAFSTGTVFGEIALIDHAPRSATVRADEALVCCVLPRAAFEMLSERHPEIAIQLLTNLARGLSRMVRHNTQTIAQLSA